jgi:transcriptional regulator NrdR family protein
MTGRAFGFECPNCEHPRSVLLEFHRGTDGIVVSLRLYCLACEHVWTEPVTEMQDYY